MEIGNQIKQHRAALSLSQEELAEQILTVSKRYARANWDTLKGDSEEEVQEETAEAAEAVDSQVKTQ